MQNIDLAAAAPAAISSAVYLVVKGSFLFGLRRRSPPISGDPASSRRAPMVSILKPIAGLDDDLAGNLESFAELDYPAYEVLFGLSSTRDPAVSVVSSFIASHPEVRAAIVWTDPDEALNPKVAQLLALTRRARGEVLVVSDSNVRAPRSYLRDAVGALLRPGVGLVSSLIVGTGERSFGALVENAQLGAFIAPCVVAAQSLVGRPITIGKSMAMRRADLARVGGWESVKTVLGEDDVMGQRFAARGYSVEAVLSPIENRNISCSMRRTFERHTRWAKIRRSISPLAFALEPLLLPWICASIALAIFATRLAALAWLIALSLQCAGALLCHSALRPSRRALLLAAIEPLRALVAFACWLRACASMRVEWRGHPFYVMAGSEVVPVGQEPPIEAESAAAARAAE